MKSKLATPASMKSTLDKIIASYEATIESCRAQLAAPVLDGTPFLLLRKALGENYERAYGEWPITCTLSGELGKVKGWQSVLVLPDHLCGAMLFSEQSGKRQIAAAKAARLGGEFRLLHRRDFVTQRIAAAEEMLTMLLEKRSQMEAALTNASK